MKRGKKKGRPGVAEDRKRYPGRYDCQGCGLPGYKYTIAGVRLCSRCARKYGRVLAAEAREGA
jgi:hypothetical protein